MKWKGELEETYQICDKTDFFVGTGHEALLKRGDGSKEGLEDMMLFIFPAIIQ
jgi:hypothetical protein